MPDNDDIRFEKPAAPERTLMEEFWFLFKRNRLSILGLIIFVVFLFVALTGLFLTSGTDPLFDPAMVRLEEKLRPPFSSPNLQALHHKEVPTLGIYLFGTDDLGRDVFSRMLQGAWVSLTVGFVAVGISIVIGVFLGGIAGYYGDSYLKIEHVLMSIVMLAGVVLLGVDARGAGAALLILGLVYISINLILKVTGKQANRKEMALLRRKAVSIDTLIMRLVDIMLCFPSFFLILTVVALPPSLHLQHHDRDRAHQLDGGRAVCAGGASVAARAGLRHCRQGLGNW